MTTLSSAQVAVLVVMIVVFFIVIGIYAAIWWKYLGSKRRNDQGRIASKTTLYYYDLHNAIQRLELPNSPASPATGPPPIGGPASQTAAHTPYSVLQAIAHDMTAIYGGTEVRPEKIVLAQRDKVSQTLWNLNLEHNLQDANRGLFLEQTATDPLYLLSTDRHVSGSGKQAFGGGGPATTTTTTTAGGGTVSVRRGNRPGVSSKRGGTGGGGGGVHSATPRSLMEPAVPKISPNAGLISTSTNITIDASAYRWADGSAEDDQGVPDQIVAIIEECLKQGAKVVHTTADNSITVTIDPTPRAFSSSNGGGGQQLTSKQIYARIGSSAPRAILKYASSNIRYCTSDSGAWQPYTGPFRLPPGRWCVQAEATSLDGKRAQSDSRVFTVEENFSQF